MKRIGIISWVSTLVVLLGALCYIWGSKTGNETFCLIGICFFALSFFLEIYYLVEAYPLLKENKIKKGSYWMNFGFAIMSLIIVGLFFIKVLKG